MTKDGHAIIEFFLSEDAPKGKLKELPGDYPFARQQDCDLHLFDFEAFGGFGREVRSTLREAANQLSNKLTHAQHLDEVTWTTKNWHGLQRLQCHFTLTR